MSKGTPKTLFEAIENGETEVAASSSLASTSIVKLHVRDFLAQHFTIAMLKADSDAERDSLKTLFQTLTD